MSGIPSEKRRHCKQRLGHFCSTRRVRALAFCAFVLCTCSTMLDDVRNAGKKPAEPENVTIKSYSVGDVLLADGTIVPYNAEDLTFADDQKKNAVGVLYSIDENGTPRGWLGIYNSAENGGVGRYRWAKRSTISYSTKIESIKCKPSDSGGGTANTATFEGDTDGSDNWQEIGEIDTEGLKNAEENYPAFHYANTYGETYNLPKNYKTGWYMPSLAELCYVYRNIALLNKVIKALGGVELTDDFYWSSSQSEHDYFAWGVSFLGGYVFDGYSKGDCFYVCCVRSFSK